MSFQSKNRVIPHDLYLTAATPAPTLRRRVALTVANWRQRTALRRRFSVMDARSLREYGISPAAAAYESGKAFWSKLGCLR
jgi:uncharacterized protein YjiS (DUF1127 family)